MTRPTKDAQGRRKGATSTAPERIYDQFIGSIPDDMRGWVERPRIAVGILDAFSKASEAVPVDDHEMFDVLRKAVGFAPADWSDFYRAALDKIENLATTRKRGGVRPYFDFWGGGKEPPGSTGVYQIYAGVGPGVVDWASGNGILSTLERMVYMEYMRRQYKHCASLYTTSSDFYDNSGTNEEGAIGMPQGRYSGLYRVVTICSSEKNELDARVRWQLDSYSKDPGSITLTEDPRTLQAEYDKGKR